MSPRTVGAVLVVAGLGLGLVGCSHEPPKFEGLPVRVTCTTTIVADVVKNVGGDRVHIETLIGPGLDPHRHIPGMGDRKKMDNAHLVFVSGLHLEGKMVDMFEKNRKRWRTTTITDGIPKGELIHADVDGGEHDPHVWFDVKLWIHTINPVRDALTQIDPDGAAIYERNAAAYTKELQALDAEIRKQLDRVPTDKRVLVTSHDAFGYFGRAYGFEVVGLQGVSTASEVGTQQRDQLADLLGKRRIPAVFTETSVPEEGLKAVLGDVAKKYKFDVKLIGDDDALFSDALGAPDTPGGTYVGMIRHNVSVIVDALSK